jgi:hypothetical protein
MARRFSTPFARGRRSSSDERGVVLILALLVTGALLSAGLYMANRALRNFLDTRTLYLKTPALFAAESGIERALLMVKRGRADADAALCTGATCNGSNDVLPVLRTLTGTLGSDPTYAVSNNTSETSSLDTPLELSLKQNQSVVFGFFPPDAINVLENSTALPKQIRLTSTGTGTQDLHAWVELRWAGFENVGGQFNLPENGTTALRSVSTLQTATTIVLTNPFGVTGCPVASAFPCSTYNFVSVRALFADVQRLRIEPLDNAGSVLKVPNRVLITSRGTVGSGTAAVNAVMTASTSWRLPASNLFDYTLFSEGDIAK